MNGKEKKNVVLKCRNCGEEVAITKSFFEKLKAKKERYVACIDCTNGAVYDVYIDGALQNKVFPSERR